MIPDVQKHSSVKWLFYHLYDEKENISNEKQSKIFKKRTFELLTRTDIMKENTRVGTLIVATIYLQLIQNRYMFRSFTVLHCSHQHRVQPVASDVEVVGYL